MDKEMLDFRHMLEIQEIREILIDKLISREEWNERMLKRVDKSVKDESVKEELKAYYNY